MTAMSTCNRSLLTAAPMFECVVVATHGWSATILSSVAAVLSGIAPCRESSTFLTAAWPRLAVQDSFEWNITATINSHSVPVSRTGASKRLLSGPEGSTYLQPRQGSIPRPSQNPKFKHAQVATARTFCPEQQQPHYGAGGQHTAHGITLLTALWTNSNRRAKKLESKSLGHRKGKDTSASQVCLLLPCRDRVLQRTAHPSPIPIGDKHNNANCCCTCEKNQHSLQSRVQRYICVYVFLLLRLHLNIAQLAYRVTGYRSLAKIQAILQKRKSGGMGDDAPVG